MAIVRNKDQRAGYVNILVILYNGIYGSQGMCSGIEAEGHASIDALRRPLHNVFGGVGKLGTAHVGGVPLNSDSRSVAASLTT